MFSLKGFAKDHPFGFELAMQAGLALVAGAGTYAVKAIMDHAGIKDPAEKLMDKKLSLFASECGIEATKMSKKYGQNWYQNKKATDEYASRIDRMRLMFK